MRAREQHDEAKDQCQKLKALYQVAVNLNMHKFKWVLTRRRPAFLAVSNWFHVAPRIDSVWTAVWSSDILTKPQRSSAAESVFRVWTTCKSAVCNEQFMQDLSPIYEDANMELAAHRQPKCTISFAQRQSFEFEMNDVSATFNYFISARSSHWLWFANDSTAK